MKKILFSLFALMAVMTVHAQSIYGTWQKMEPEVTTMDDGTYLAFNPIFTFNEDGTLFSIVDLTYSSEPAQTKEMEVALMVRMNGCYMLEDNHMEMAMDRNTLKVELVSLSLNGKVVKDPEMEARFKEVFRDEALKASFDGESLTGAYTIRLRNNGSMLDLIDEDGETMTMMRIATIRK